ncbi:hydrogenase maturation protease [Hyphomicrobium sp.]|uniref:hydrogenase maturation protease n=1 Tax=Hyphomicrobium sp. TaxID=82 RepID=UPI0025B7AC60|nr:hydrogenase maturation protease [Hyphomicrobium sp.]MCC7253159.1 hydrogenase maturation protease [Hyphomicrobium sp.]
MIAVIGCGNANRTDDAAGLEVIRLLKGSEALRRRPDVQLLDAGTDGMAVMFAARGCTTLIVVDSCRTEAEAGAIFEVPGSEVETKHTPSLNLHDFRWDHALYAGRQIYRDAFPKDVTAFLIEAHSLELGCELTADVARSVAVVAQRIEARIMARTESRPCPETRS